MAKVNKEFDIKRVFTETKEALNRNITKSEGRIDMLTELEQFFDANNLKVVQEVEEEPTTNSSEDAKKQLIKNIYKKLKFY